MSTATLGGHLDISDKRRRNRQTARRISLQPVAIGEAPRMRGAVETLKVSSKSNPNAVAGAMAGVVRQQGSVGVQVVGAGALNQAIKAIAIARGYVAPSGVDLVCVPTFADIEIDGQGRTAIYLVVGGRDGATPPEVDVRDAVPAVAPHQVLSS